MAQYLRDHPLNLHRREAPEFLIGDPSRAVWYVRWPNGSLRWETTAALRARAIALPARGLLEQARPA